MGQLSYNAARGRRDAIVSLQNTMKELNHAIVAGEEAQTIYPEYNPADLIEIRNSIRKFLASEAVKQ